MAQFAPEYSIVSAKRFFQRAKHPGAVTSLFPLKNARSFFLRPINKIERRSSYMPLYRKRNIHHVIVSIELDDLKIYSEKMEEQLQHQVDGFNEWFEQQSEGMSDEDKNKFGEYYSDEYHTLARTNLTLFRSSTLLTIYTCLEKHLKRLCLNLQNKLNHSNNLLPKKAYIHHCRDFLVKHSIVNENVFNESYEWNQINKVYREIRNAFAHNQGEIDEEMLAQIQEGIKNLKCSIDNQTDEVKLEKAFCFEFIQTIEAFFDSLFDNIDPTLFRTPR
jgi:hypothetical protein